MRINRLSSAIIALLAIPFTSGSAVADDASELRKCVQVLRHSGKEPVAFVLDRLRDRDLLIFDDGLHTAVEPFAFYQQLIRDPAFQRQVKFIFLEALPLNRQPQLDAYLNAGREDPTILYPAFQDDYSGTGFPYKTYFDLLHTVYAVNQKLPKAERLRVIAVSNPVHWPDIKTAEDLALFRKGLAGRDALMYELILDELAHFQDGRKGIFLTNTRHAYKSIRDRQNRLYWNCGTWFHERHPGKTYSLRCHQLVLLIEKSRARTADQAVSAEGMERFAYRWVRPGRGLWDEAWLQLENQPVAVPLADTILGQEPYVGNHMLDAAPGQTFADAYDAILFLMPLEKLRQTAMIGDIYTPAFRRELLRRLHVLYTPEQLTKRIHEAQVATVEALIDKQYVAAPEQPLPQLQGLEPSTTWRTIR
jgi:hypothetical protein